MEIQQDVVHADLAPYLVTLRSGIAMAVAEYNGIYEPGVRRIHSKRSRASLIHDHIVNNMAHFAEGSGGVQLHLNANLWLLSFPEGYLIRFKKVGKKKLASGIKTGQSSKFRRQEQLDGLPHSVNLDLSYELDSSGMLKAVYLICPAGRRANMWDSELCDDGARPVVVSLFGTPSEPKGATLLPKKRDKKDETESGDGNSSA